MVYVVNIIFYFPITFAFRHFSNCSIGPELMITNPVHYLTLIASGFSKRLIEYFVTHFIVRFRFWHLLEPQRTISIPMGEGIIIYYISNEKHIVRLVTVSYTHLRAHETPEH